MSGRIAATIAWGAWALVAVPGAWRQAQAQDPKKRRHPRMRTDVRSRRAGHGRVKIS
jgi:hypothetical protein